MGIEHNKALICFLDSLSRYEDERGDGHIAGELSAMSLSLMYQYEPHELTEDEVDALAEKVRDLYEKKEK
jgi:hypothetical protein